MSLPAERRTRPRSISRAFRQGQGSSLRRTTATTAATDENASVRVGAGETVSYGVTADNSAFEEVMRVLKFVANGTSPSSADISSALDLPNTALDDTAAVRTKLSSAASSIETASARQTDYKSYAETLSSDLTSVDVAAVTAELSTYQAQLTASHSALGKILRMNLASYLK